MALLTIFGERPGPNTDPERPLYPHTTTGAAARLIRLLDWTTDFYLENTLRYNVVDNLRVSTRSDNARTRVILRMQEERRVNPNARFLFLGKEALSSMKRQGREPLWDNGEIRGDVMYIPHPSGRNLFYNDEQSVRYIKSQLVKFFD